MTLDQVQEVILNIDYYCSVQSLSFEPKQIISIKFKQTWFLEILNYT